MIILTKTCVLAAGILLASAASALAQTPQTGFLDRTVTVDGDEYRYQIYVPRGFQPATKWPVIVSLHGGGEYGNDGIRPTAGALGNIIRRFPERVPALVIFPQAHADGKPGWQGAAGRAALAAVDRAIAEFSGDPARVGLVGYSAGGNGVWYLASHYPERFAAVVVICGFVSEFRGRTTGVVYPSLGSPSEADPYTAVAKRTARLPIWLFMAIRIPRSRSRNPAGCSPPSRASEQRCNIPSCPGSSTRPGTRRSIVPI